MCYVSMLCWFSSELFCSLMNSGLCCLVSLWSVCGPGEGRIDYLALADLQCVWKIEKNKTKVTVHKAIQTGWRWPWPTAQRFPLYFTRHQLVLFKWALNSFTAETIFYLDEDKGLCFLPRMNADGWMQNAGTQVNSELYLTPFPGVLYPAPQREYFQTSLWPLISTPPPTSANTPRKEWYLYFYSQ